jgi:predicted HicB family RNase H-like nuclease
MEDITIQISLRLPTSLARVARIEAAKMNLSRNEWIIWVLQQFIQRQSETQFHLIKER